MSAAEPVRLVLELRGPLAPEDLAAALAALDVDLAPGELDEALAAVGAVPVHGPGGRPLVALPTGPRPRPGPGPAADDDDPGAVALLRSAPPWLLVALVAAVLVVAVVLLASLNGGSREGPTLTYRPPVTAGG